MLKRDFLEFPAGNFIFVVLCNLKFKLNEQVSFCGVRRDNMEYKDAKMLIVNLLIRDARHQSAGLIDRVGDQFDEYDAIFPRDYEQLNIAWTFWDSWVDEKNHNFPGFYNDIAKDKWPVLAIDIAESLERHDIISNDLVLTYFDLLRGSPCGS
jgi:hypothetical protein